MLPVWTAILYFSALSNPFIYDDQPQIVQNPHLVSPSAAMIYVREPALFGDAFGAQSGSFYRPLFWLTLVLDKGVGGGSAEIFHATNLLLHAINGILVYLLFRRFLAGVLPLAAALAWESLPIHTEVVAWISGRGLSLATFFVLVAAIAAVKYAERRSAKYLWLEALTCCAAFLSHEAGVVAPLLAGLAVLSIAAPPGRSRTTVRVLIAGAIPVAVLAAFRVIAFHMPGLVFHTLPEFLLQGPVTMAKYVWWTIVAPGMSMERSSELLDVTFQSWIFVAAVLTIAGIVAVAAALRHSMPLFAAGFAAAAIALLPFAQILKLYQSVAERYVYTASIGIVLAVTALLVSAQRKLRLPVWSPAAVLVVWAALLWLPIQDRVHAWSSEETLYLKSLDSSPKSALLHQNLGVLYARMGDVSSASTYFRTATQLQPSYVQAHLNLANLDMRSGQLSDAVTEFQQVLKYDPDNVGAQLSLSNLLGEQGDLDSAFALLTKIIQQHPDSYEAELGLGIVLHQKRDPGARSHLERALELKPDSAATAFNLAAIEEEAGNLEGARKLYQQVLRFHPGDPDALQHLEKIGADRRTGR